MYLFVTHHAASVGCSIALIINAFAHCKVTHFHQPRKNYSQFIFPHHSHFFNRTPPAVNLFMAFIFVDLDVTEKVANFVVDLAGDASLP